MRTLETKALISMLALLGATACNAEGSTALERSAAVAGNHSAASVSPKASDVVASRGDDDVQPMGDDWEAWVAAEVERIREAKPELYDAIRGLEPRMTRGRFLRFTDPVLNDPDAAPLLLDRFVNGNDTTQVRAAVIEAIPRTGGAFGPAMVDLLSRERDADVRVVMVESMRRADATSAQHGLEQAFTDRDANVRVQAALTVARRSDGAELADALVIAASDPDDEVKRTAVQSLGALKVEQAKDALVGLLSQDDPELRFLSLRALERIDAGYVAALPKAKALRDDADPRVAKLATRLTTP
jgi:hypothetical protein